MRGALLASVLAAWPALMAQDSRGVILVGGGAHFVEVIDRVSLETYGRIHFKFPIGSMSLNGVALSADGATVYVEGPAPLDPNSCCYLYSTDVATLRTGVAASIPGSRSRDSFVISDGLVHRTTALSRNGVSEAISSSRLYLSPNGKWLSTVRSAGGPALAMVNLEQGRVAREFTLPGSNGNSLLGGTWAGDLFYLYAAIQDGWGRLWTVLPEATKLGEGVEVKFDTIADCRAPDIKSLTAAMGRLFVYEVFGFKGDRKRNCGASVPGGAWMLDPGSGRLLSHIAGDVAFSALMGDRTEPVLYGLGSGKLLRIDAGDGRVLKSRTVDSRFLRMTVGSMRVVPAGDVIAVPQ
jgi:hypothetical protein